MSRSVPLEHAAAITRNLWQPRCEMARGRAVPELEDMQDSVRQEGDPLSWKQHLVPHVRLRY
jgi:hypothetical protein